MLSVFTVISKNGAMVLYSTDGFKVHNSDKDKLESPTVSSLMLFLKWL